MKKITLALFVFGACQQSPAPAPTPPTKKITPVSVPVSAPVSAPVSVPVSMPTSASQPTSASLPTRDSMPSSAPSSAAALLESGEAVYYYLDGPYPNPKVDGQLGCEAEEDTDTTSYNCELLLQTTALYSCLCSSYQLPTTDDRGASPIFEMTASNYFIEGDSARRLSLSDLFKPEYARRFNKDGIFTIDADDEGPIFSFYEAAYDSSEPKTISGEELKKMLLPNSPLLTLEKTGDFPTDYDDDVASKGKLTVSTLDTRAAPASMPAEGTILQAFRWVDKNGENTALFSEQKSTSKDKLKSTVYLYVNHYTKKDELITKVRNVVDKQEKCAKPNNLARFVEGTPRITDVDRDGVGEIGFAYQLGCVDDPSEGGPIKAFLLEDTEKYALRGDSSGTYKADKVLEKAPEIFTTYLHWLFTQ